MSRNRPLKAAYVWGALSNSEPPDDDEDVIGYYGPDEVIVTQVMPPVPTDAWDWSATLRGYEPGDPQGFGATADDAVADLMEQVSA